MAAAMRMKVKEIEKAIKDGTPVAVYTGYKGRSTLDLTGARQAMPLAVRQPRKARGEWSSVTKNDGVKVRLLGKDSNSYGAPKGRAGTEIVLAPTDVLGAWDEYESRVADARAHDAAYKEARAKTEARLDAVLKALGVGHRGYHDEIVLHLEDAEELATRLDG